MELFKGYIVTKDKKCLEKFKNRKDFKTYNQVKNLPEFAGILNDNVVLIDIDDFNQSEILFKIVTDLKLNCRVYKTSRGKHFLFKNTEVESCKTHTKLAVGLTSDIKLGSRNSYSILKYDGVERQILYDSDIIDELPKWLLPIKTHVDFTNMSEGDGRNQSLFNYILTLQSGGYSKEEAKECIQLINKYVLEEPLSDSELEVIIRDEAFQKPVFYDGKTFLFDKFAKYLISQLHLIKINGRLHVYRDGVYIDGGNLIEAEMIKYIPNLNRQKRAEVLAYIDISIINNSNVSPANFIAFKNGIYDLNEDKLIDFNPSIIITNKINYDYNPDAYNEAADKTLNKLACNDPDIRALLEEVVGYTFFRRNELRKSFVLVGNKSNGKSTYLNMIETLLGDENTSALDLNELSHEFKAFGLFGKLANIGDDIGDEFIADAAVFKKIVSGDRINANVKHGTPVEFNPYCKLLFSANSIPRIGKAKGSDAIIDRLIIVPFNATFSPKDPDFDPYIKYKLKSAESMEYLIKIGLEGLKNVMANRHFTISQKVQKEIEEYEENNNPILLFFKDYDKEQIMNNTTKDIYKKYSEFCLSNNFTAMSNIEFSKQVNKYYGLEVISKSIKGKTYRVFVSSGG